MKFRFQVNGVIEFESDVRIPNISEYITNMYKASDRIRLTGITVFEIEGKNPGGKGTAHKKSV